MSDRSPAAPGEPSIFVSYRRADDPFAAALVAAALLDRFGTRGVFLDTLALRPRSDPSRRLPQALARSTVLLALIGPHWEQQEQLRRQREAPDWVRWEITEAATSLLAPAPLAKLDQLMEMFSADPAARPRATEWIRLLRNTATTTQHALPPPGPQPVPEQPSPAQPIVPPRPRRRIGRLAAAVATILVAGVVLGVAATRSLAGERAAPSGAQPSRAEPAPASPVTTTTAAPPVTSSAPATTSSGAPPTVATIVPAAVTVRRQSGDRPLRLTAGYQADLDSLAPDWEVASRGVNGADIHLVKEISYYKLASENGVDFAPVSGPPAYTTCQNATAYYSGINLNDDRSGYSFCARTSNRRFAFVTIVDPKVPVALDITIWDPPRR